MGLGRNNTWGSKRSNTNFQKRWLQKKENCCDPVMEPNPPPVLPFCLWTTVLPAPIDWTVPGAGDFYINGILCPAALINSTAIATMQGIFGPDTGGYISMDTNEVTLWAYSQLAPTIVIEDASSTPVANIWVSQQCEITPVCYETGFNVTNINTTSPLTISLFGINAYIDQGVFYDDLTGLNLALAPLIQGIFGASAVIFIETDGSLDGFRVTLGTTLMVPVNIINTDATGAALNVGGFPCPPIVTFAGLVMTFQDSNLIPFDPSDVNNWNTFMYASGSPFIGVTLGFNTVTLFGYNNTGLQPAVFLGDSNILGFVDQTSQIIAVGNEFFKQSTINYFTLNGLSTIPTEMCYQCTGMTSCNIQGATSIGTSAFQESALTSIYGPSCISIGNMAFKECAILFTSDFPVCTSVGMMGFHITSNMTTGSFPLLTTIGDYGFEESNLSVYSDFTNITTLGVDTFENSQLTGGFVFNFLVSPGGNNFASCNSITDITCPNLPAVPVSFCSSCAGLQFFSAPIATSVGDSAFFGCAALTNQALDNVDTFGASVFEGCSSLLTVTFNKMVTGGASMMKNCTGLFEFRAALATTIGPNHFENCTTLIIVDLLICADFGGTPGDNNVFLGISGNTIDINVPIVLQTIDGGNPDGDLVYVAANNTATINYL